MAHEDGPHLDLDDAIQFIVRYIRSGKAANDMGSKGTYGYEIYLPVVMMAYLVETGTPLHQARDAIYSGQPVLSPIFYAAGWELCRRGILRPGIREAGAQATADGSSGNGYSITPFGREWLERAAAADYVPLEPLRFARMLADRGVRFGPGFIERSQEAVRAYNAQAYLACCAMCGAAAESIVLALVIAKTGDARKVMNNYAGSGGRGRVERLLIGSRDKYVQGDFHRYVDLLKYWRDSAAHGKAAAITELEGWTSLVLLLRFAIFASDRWDELTQ